MIDNNKILLGKAGEESITLQTNQINRHGLIAGASGTGKTVSLKVIAEGLSELGVPTVIADVKGDLTGMIVPGDMTAIQERVTSMGLKDFTCQKYPVHFYDVYGKQGHPVRAQMEEMGSMLLGRILDLSDAQQGVLSVIFKIAQDMNLNIIDMKDLQAMATYVGEHSSDYTVKYGTVTKASTGIILRKLLQLSEDGGEVFFGQPSLDINDWLVQEGGKGVMNILEAEELFQHPALYSTFLLWMLNELYEKLPEVGDLEKPKVVFFFDEAHLLFDNASKALLEKIEQIVKLVRSKGVGIFFITQSPSDIPNEVLAQLSNRVQHSLRAYTPAEIKATKLAAEAFRANPKLDTAERITNMKTGTALVSVLGEDGAPTIVQETKICPPQSSMKMATADQIKACIQGDSIAGKYEAYFDANSAYEDMDNIRQVEAQEKAQAEKEKQAAKAEEKRKQKEANQPSFSEKMTKKMINQGENALAREGIRQAKKFLKGLLK